MQTNVTGLGNIRLHFPAAMKTPIAGMINLLPTFPTD